MPDANPAPISDEITKHYKRGDTDPGGSVVEEVYWTTKKYQIYDDGKQVRCILPDDYDEAAKLRQRLYVISEQRATIDTLRAHPATRKRDKDFSVRMLARCMAQAFEGHAERALAILKSVSDGLETAIENRYRLHYVFACTAGLLVTVLVLLGSIRALSGHDAAQMVSFDVAVLIKYAKLAILGALGAFLSVSIGIRKIVIDVEAMRTLHLVSGASRIVIGVIGAMVVGLALDSKLISPTFGSAADVPVYYLMAFVAGFSETFVPNTLRRAEQAAGGSEGAANQGNAGSQNRADANP